MKTVSSMKTVPETADAVSAMGVTRASTPSGKLLLASLLAGLYIAVGGALAIRAGCGVPAEWGPAGRLLFAAAFPLGLLLVVFGGAALFTGDVMYVFGGMFRRKVDVPSGVKSLLLSWTGNLGGALLLVYIIHWTGILLDGGGSGGPAPMALYTVKLGAAKCSQGFWTLFVKGILCNQLVCLAVFMALCSPSPAAKAILIWPPIFGFVALGMEHSVANMFFIPAGMLAGSDPGYLASPGAVAATYGWSDFFVKNLVPVTFGNIVGGGIFVAAPYCLGLRPPQTAADQSDSATARRPGSGSGEAGAQTARAA
ncbi:MAG: formate/nitrite transporter family protein [Deltaproteobacteria bacterium]|jgi:formate/nitrite transporter|nr:formate/nitrite transporter family protein [Deltaproteobacteria bacterium]